MCLSLSPEHILCYSLQGSETLRLADDHQRLRWTVVVPCCLLPSPGPLQGDVRQSARGGFRCTGDANGGAGQLRLR